MRKNLQVILLTVMILLFSFSAAAAQSSFTLDKTEITLAPGESYTFTPSFEPEEPQIPVLSWVSSDPSVASVESQTNTVTALKAGKTLLFTQTYNGALSTFCKVTVSGEAGNADGSKSSSVFSSLSDADLAKIGPGNFKNYVDFMRMAESAGLSTISADEQPVYKVIIMADRSDQSAVLEKAKALGITEIRTYQNFDDIALQARADQLADILVGNNAVQSMIMDHLTLLPKDPVSEDDAAKAITLKDHVESITTVSAMHNAGVTGKGTVVAIMDTGLDANHPEFMTNGVSRVKYQSCHSTTGTTDSMTTKSACKSADSALPNPPDSGALGEFNHGSHVTGIAAGNGGIAPAADIAAIQVFSEVFYVKDGVTKYSSGAYTSDQLAGIEDVLNWAKGGANIVALNMSLGDYDSSSSAYASFCDNLSEFADMKAAFEDLKAKNIIIPVASGNEAGDKDYIPGTVGSPACLSGAFTVGALDNQETPTMAYYSDYGTMVSIAAPGTSIYSSILGHSSSDYDTFSGTSMATPVISGSIALLRSVFTDQTIDETKSMLKDLTAKKISISYDPNADVSNPAATVKLDIPVVNFDMISELLITPADLAAAVSGVTATFTYTPNSSVYAGMQVYVSPAYAGTYVPGCTAEGTSTSCAVSNQPAGDLYYKARHYLVYNGKTFYGVWSTPAYVTIGQSTPNTPTATMTFTSTLTPTITLTPTSTLTPTATSTATATATMTATASATLDPATATAIAATSTAAAATSVAGTSVAATSIAATSTAAAAATATMTPSMTPTATSTEADYDWYMFGSGFGWYDEWNGFYSNDPRNPFNPANAGKIPGTGFSGEHFTALPDMPRSLTYKDLGFEIELPSIDVNAKMVGIPLQDGNWPVEWLGDAAGVLQGSSVPGAGPTFIAAHNHLNTMKAGPFLFINELKTNDRIFIHDSNGTVINYRVVSNKLTEPDDFAEITAESKQYHNPLVLITCENESVNGGYNNRRVVFAEEME